MTEQEKEILEEEMDTGADSGAPDSEDTMADSGAPDSEDTVADDACGEETCEGSEPKTWAEKKAAKKQAKADKKADASKEKIAELEREEKWDIDVEDDPVTKTLMPDQIDYLNKKLTSKIANFFANKAGTAFYEKLIKNKIIAI